MLRILCLILGLLVSSGAYAETKTLVMPGPQKAFIEVMMDYAAKYQAEKNPLKKTMLVQKRFDALGKTPNTAKFSGWYAQVKGIGTGDGKAWVSLAIDGYPFKMKTWNNRFSDIQLQTMIPPQSPIFASLAEMSVGRWVKIAGTVVDEGSLTESGRMVDPEWIVRFSKIEPVVFK